MTTRPIFVALLITALAAPICLADETSHREAALRLLDVTDARSMWEEMQSMIEAIVEEQLMSLGLPPEADDAEAAVQQEIMDWFAELFTWDDMRELYADIYVEVFTEDELNGLAEFYQTPLGKKSLQKLPQIMQMSMERTQIIMESQLPALERRLYETMEELEARYNIG